MKPEKSYVNANHEGPPIKMKVSKENTNSKPRVDKEVHIQQDEFWRHMGNIQNNIGETKLEDVAMNDGLVQVKVANRIVKMI